MDYELAKSLMDAGFPQIGKGSLIGSLDKLVWRSGDRVYVPTLEELIEACGENFGSLDKQHYGWLAYATYDQSYFAKTSVEAVERSDLLHQPSSARLASKMRYASSRAP